MNDFWGSQAERLKHVEIESRLRKAIEGDVPGKRKRSYHRALKREAPWALIKQGMQEMQGRLAREVFGVMLNKVMNPNPMLGLSAWLPSKENHESIYGESEIIKQAQAYKPQPIAPLDYGPKE